VLAALRLQTLQIVGEAGPERNRVEDIFQTARTLVSEAVVRVQAQTRLWIERLLRNINEVAVGLSECTDAANLRQRLSHELPKLDINQLIVATFYRDNAESRKRRASVFFVLDGSGTSSQLSAGPFLAEGLLPDEFSASERDRSFVVLPLFFGKESLGYALIDCEIDHGAVYEALRLQLSASLWKALMSSTDVGASMAPATIRQVVHCS
jgi:hypothetical protein